MGSDSIRCIGVLTSGGDAPGLNAVIRAVVKTAASYDYTVLGIEDGYEGLLGQTDMRILTPADVRGILPQGGTILHTTNRGSFGKRLRDCDPTNNPYREAIANMERRGIDALVTIGGEGTQSIAHDLYHLGVPVVGVPKTIDNDLSGTDLTFGFDTALQVATDALDRLHTTAASHNRVMILEVMGRHAGWIALECGIAGGADVILIPEIPFYIQKVAEKIRQREVNGANFSIVVVSEGAHPVGGAPIYQAEGRLGGIGFQVCNALEDLTGKETRSVVLGHLQRGGPPTPFDRVLATRYGASAVHAIKEGSFGQMVALHGTEIVTVPLEEAIGMLKTVPLDSRLLRTARDLGVSLAGEDD